MWTLVPSRPSGYKGEVNIVYQLYVNKKIYPRKRKKKNISSANLCGDEHLICFNFWQWWKCIMQLDIHLWVTDYLMKCLYLHISFAWRRLLQQRGNSTEGRGWEQWETIFICSTMHLLSMSCVELSETLHEKNICRTQRDSASFPTVQGQPESFLRNSSFCTKGQGNSQHMVSA